MTHRPAVLSDALQPNVLRVCRVVMELDAYGMEPPSMPQLG